MLGDARSVLNVGAGAGSYEPTDRRVEITPVPVPRDCVDGFLGAHWARPEAYLEEKVRAGISSFARPGADAGIARLRADLASGAWHARHGHVLTEDALDVGYRLVVAQLPERAG